MSMSAFEEPLVTGSTQKLIEGQKYVVELTDIIKQNKCVAFKEALRGKKDANGKSIIGKEYDSLSPEMQAFVDNAPAEFWPLGEFVSKATGMLVKGDEGYTWGNLFPKGSKFVGTVIKRGNFLGLDVGSIVKKELAGPVVDGASVPGELSETAKKLLEHIKTNMVGKSKASVFDLFDSGQFGTYTETQKAWTEIQRSGIKISEDGRTFGGF